MRADPTPKKCLAPLAALLATVFLAILCQPALAHDFTLTDTLVLLKVDGTYQVDVRCDLDALALGADPATDSAELAARLRALPADELAARAEKLRSYFLRRVRLRVDGETVLPAAVSFPEHGTPLADEAELPTVLGTTARLAGRLPEGGGELTLQLSRSFPPAHLTILDQATLDGRRELLEAGTRSTPYRLGEAGSRSAESSSRESSGGAGPNALSTAGRYLALGFQHILPKGLDHILFVLGLFLLSTRWRPLLWQVTAFTAAHTLTLALSTYGVIRLSPEIVEPLIALSIAYVAIENVLTSELKPWRPLVVFLFGLLHGLGFAGVLGELGLPEGELLAALLSFNVGVELGQLAVIGGAFLLLGAFRNRPWYRQRVVIPLSLAIAAMGLYWAVARAF